MNTARIIPVLLGALYAAFVALAYSFSRKHPYIALPAVAVLVVLIDLRNRRKLVAAETILASLACPTCAAQFGLEAASRAIRPPGGIPGSRFLMWDDRGYSTAICPSCGVRSYFRRRTHALTLTSPYAPFV